MNPPPQYKEVRFPSSGSPLLGRKRRNFDISGEEAGSDSDSHSSDDRDCKCTRCLQEDESHLRRRMHENVAAQLKDASRQLRQARQHLADAKDELGIAQGRLAENEEESEKLNDRLDQVETAALALQQQRDALQQETENLHERLRGMDQALEVAQAEFANSQHQLAGVQRSHDRLSDRLVAANIEQEQLQLDKTHLLRTIDFMHETMKHAGALVSGQNPLVAVGLSASVGVQALGQGCGLVALRDGVHSMCGVCGDQSTGFRVCVSCQGGVCFGCFTRLVGIAGDNTVMCPTCIGPMSKLI